MGHQNGLAQREALGALLYVVLAHSTTPRRAHRSPTATGSSWQHSGTNHSAQTFLRLRGCMCNPRAGSRFSLACDGG
jgi:hypothetical protein